MKRVTKRKLKLAKFMVKHQIKRAGLRVSDFSSKEIENAAKRLCREYTEKELRSVK